MLQKDQHVSVHPTFTVPEGKMEQFKAMFEKFYTNTKQGTKETIFYGFGICGNKVYCREHFVSAEGVLQHLAEVQELLGQAMGILGEGCLELKVVGSSASNEKLKPALEPMGATFYELQDGAFLMNTTFKNKPPRTGACWPLCGGQKVDDV